MLKLLRAIGWGVRARLFGALSSAPAGWRGEVCKRCWRANVVGYALPDEVWDRVVADRFTVLCLTCLDELAAPLGVDWSRELELHPVSTAAWQEAA